VGVLQGSLFGPLILALGSLVTRQHHILSRSQLSSARHHFSSPGVVLRLTPYRCRLRAARYALACAHFSQITIIH